MDSSRAEVCSGEVPFLEGSIAEGDSFSTCKGRRVSVRSSIFLMQGHCRTVLERYEADRAV